MISLLKNKEVSPREALDSILSRIEETNKDINAIVTICEKRAIEKIDGLASNVNNIPGFLETIFGLDFLNLIRNIHRKVRTIYFL